MCGIWGRLGNTAQADFHSASIHDALKHRGPDGEGVETIAQTILGHRRLSIIDLSSAGAQPMWDAERRACITYNGEIYNYRELREECRAAGLTFRSTSDTEVILNLYLLHGAQSFTRLNGMFAFCLFDKRSGEAWLVRDPMGIKPLYYAPIDGAIVFASEMAGLLASGLIPFDVDRQALQSYMMLDFVPGPASMLRGVQKLPGGSLLHYRAGSFSVRTYSSVASTELLNAPSPEGDVARLDRCLHGAVERQLVADVPVGVFLSGGIDSSLVALAASDIRGRIATFSVAFDDASFDERPYFDLVARAIGSEHHTESLTAASMEALLPDVARIVSEPLADGSIFPTCLLARFARQHVKVALSGDGADELFAGYPTHRVAASGRRLALLPRAARRLALAAAHRALPVSYGNFAFDFRVKKFLEGIDRDGVLQNERWLASFQPEEIAEYLVDFDGPAMETLLDALHEPSRALLSHRPLEAILRTDRRFYLQDGVLVKVDRATMASSLEVRVPFLDNEMVELANGLPADRKLRRGQTKWILRELARRRLPAAIADRPKKGFGVPLGRWFRGELREMVRDVLSPDRLRRDGFFHPDRVTELLAEHEQGRRDHRKRIFNLLMFTLWHDWARRAAA